MLGLRRTRTRISDEPGLPAAVERAAGRGLAAAVRHDAADDHALDGPRLQDLRQVGVDERVVGVLVYDDTGTIGELPQHRHQLPVCVVRIPADRPARPPLAHELVPEGWR